MHCVYIVAGIRLYREGLALLLSNRPEFTVTGTARCRGDALAQLARSLPDVVLVDLTTEDSATIIRDIKRVAPSLPSSFVRLTCFCPIDIPIGATISELFERLP